MLDSAAMTTVAALSARFARDIEQAMEARRMTRADLAILLRVSRPYITQVLSGKTNLTFKTASELATAVGLTSWVVYETEEPEETEKKYLQKGFNKQLAHVIEECGEVLAAAGKTQRWGRDSTDPTKKKGDALFGETNAEWLLREMDDLTAAMERLRKTIAAGG